MKKGIIIDFIVSLPFIAALAFFIMYIRYYFIISGSSEISSIMSLYLLRCRNLALFCLVIGVILLIIKNVVLLFKSNESNTQELSINKQETTAKTYSLSNEAIVNNILKNKDINFLIYF